MKKQLKRLFNWLRTRKIRVLDIVFAISLFISYMIFVLCGFDLTLDLDFNTKIESGYFCVLDKQGGVYIIDRGQERLFKVKDHKVEWEISDTKNEKICQVENVVIDDDGSVYVHETQWDETGWLLENELINKYESDGEYIATKYSISYDENNKKDVPTLFNLRIVDGHLEYVKLNDNGFEVFKIVNDEAVLKSQHLFEDALKFTQRIVASSKTNNMYILDRRGKVLCVDEKGNMYTYYELNSEIFAYDLSVGSDESIYIVDAHSQSIHRISPQKEIEEIFNYQNVYNDINADKNHGAILSIFIDNIEFEDGRQQEVICGVFGYERLYAAKQDGEVLYNESNFEPSENYFCIKMIKFFVSWIWTLSVVLLGIRFIFVAFFYRSNLSILFIAEIIIILTTALILLATLPLPLASIYDTYIDGMSHKVLSMAQVASKNIDPEKLRNINKSSNFMDDDYKDLFNQLNIATFCYDNSEETTMGGSISKFVGDVAVDAIYSHIRTGVYRPLSDKNKKEIMEIYETKKSKVGYIESIIGGQAIARSPIIDSNGEVVGCVCIQQNVSKLQKNYNDILEKLIVDVLSVIILGIFIVNEIIEFIKQRETYKIKAQVRKNVFNKGTVPPYHILRISNVIFSMALNVSAVFLPIYILLFNVPDYFSELGIPIMIAGSIPISVNTAFMFLASTFSLSIFERFGFKKVIIFAICCSILGDIMMATADSYSMLLLAMVINGMGYGLLIESKRSYLAQLPYNELNRIQVFCSSGESSGKFIGLFIGGFLAAILEYNEVFWMAVLIDIVAFGFCVYFYKTYSGLGVKNADTTPKMRVLELLRSKQILSYLIIIPTILGILAGFAGYYIPIYGVAHDFYENEISLSLAVILLCPVFVASRITKTAIKKFGIHSIYIAILTALGAMLLLVNFSQLPLFISSLLLLGLFYSFGLGVGRYKFSKLKKVKEYGENRAQSIYNLFYAIGIFISPLLFGYLLSSDFSTSMWYFAISIVLIMTVYKVFFDEENSGT